jgi:hypothetical protein
MPTEWRLRGVEHVLVVQEVNAARSRVLCSHFRLQSRRGQGPIGFVEMGILSGWLFARRYIYHLKSMKEITKTSYKFDRQEKCTRRV